jgi:hypothetical protein
MGVSIADSMRKYDSATCYSIHTSFNSEAQGFKWHFCLKYFTIQRPVHLWRPERRPAAFGARTFLVIPLQCGSGAMNSVNTCKLNKRELNTT